jgi:hypothetical protein
MMTTDDKYKSKITKTDADGEARYGKEQWHSAIGAIGRAVPNGVAPDQMKQVLDGPDAAGHLYQVGRAALAEQIEGKPGERIDPDLEAQWTNMRAAEREAFRKRRGW